MIDYLSRLKNIDADNFTNIPYDEPTKPTKPTKGAFDGFDGSFKEKYIKNISDIDISHSNNDEKKCTIQLPTKPSKDITLSHWWLLDLDNGDALQVCSYPYSNKSQILNHYPNAIDAKPIACQVSNESIVDAGELLRQMHEASFTVTLIGDVIDVQPLQWIDAELVMLIKTHKQGLIDLLEMNYE